MTVDSDSDVGGGSVVVSDTCRPLPINIVSSPSTIVIDRNMFACK
jgi:hypothetical protein